MVLVSNDLTFDQRVRKTVGTLERDGWDVEVVGRLLPTSKPVGWTQHATRYRLRFNRRVWFYAELTWVFARHLLRAQRVDLVWANDLDTLLPARLLGWAKRVPVVFDSHEFFTEAEGLSGRPLQRGVWLAVERLTMPTCRSVIAVNDGIADALADRYPQAAFGRPLVVRNMPVLRPEQTRSDRSLWARYGVPTERPILLMQGAFMDRDRGAKAAVEALDAMPEVTLVLIGSGSEFDWATSQQPHYGGRLVCIPKLPFDELVRLTAAADVGLSLDSAVCGNFYMSLPNKLFDYIHAGLPVVATDLPEIRRVITEHAVGQITPSTSPADLSSATRSVLATDRETWRSRCELATTALHWDVDSPRILQAVARAVEGVSERAQPVR